MRRRLVAVVAVVLVGLTTACGAGPPAAPSGSAPAGGGGPASPAATPPSSGPIGLPTRSAGPVPRSGDSGIDGTTTVGGCPVQRTDPPCSDKPVAAHVSVTDAVTGSPVVTADSGTDGRFSVAVRPGRYRVRPQPRAGALARAAASVEVTVLPGHYTTVTLRMDSGIR